MVDKIQELEDDDIYVRRKVVHNLNVLRKAQMLEKIMMKDWSAEEISFYKIYGKKPKQSELRQLQK